MEFTNNQKEIMDLNYGMNILVEGYSGVGKTTILLKKYEQLYNFKNVSKNETVIIVSSEIKKRMLEYQYFLISSNYNVLNILTINELIYKYLERIDLPLFQNTITNQHKHNIIRILVEEYNQVPDFTVDFILDEINFIQSNICFSDHEVIEETLKKELKTYLVTPRRSIKKGLISFREKQNIWDIYTKYLTKSLNEDFFDEKTFYQSFLRLLYHHFDQKELALTFSNLFVDDIEDFSKVQLDILYHLYDQSKEHHFSLITLDELKSMDRHKNFKNSLLFKAISSSVYLDTNYRNSKNVYQIILSNLSNNELLIPKHPYQTANHKNEPKSVLTYFYNKSIDEKREVFFDRLDLLIHNMDYRFKDILVVFYDYNNLNDMRLTCLENNIKVIDIYDRVENPEVEALTFVYKEDLVNCEFKVVYVYDADNRKICTGPINKIINVNNNYKDSIYFYQTLSIASDFLIINSSISEPSHLLLPSKIDYNQFVFEIGSQFQIKSTLNVNRISDFTYWIKENLIQHYNYKNEHFFSHDVFDMLIDVDLYKIGFKILDNNIDSDTIGLILQSGKELTHIVIFDIHHYITFKNINNEFIRVIDIPNK